MTLGLTVYDTALFLARPALPFLMKRRLARGKEDPARVGERYGRSSVARPEGPLVWLHGASVGECTCVLPLIDRILESYPDHTVLLTSGTRTSAELMAKRLPKQAIHQYVPIDHPSAVNRFLKHWQPDVAIFVESEIWPNILRQTKKRGTAMLLVNARMSERSADRWTYAPNTVRTLLSHYDACLAQSEADAQRLVQLGAPHVSITGNLKFDVAAPPVSPSELAAMRKAIGKRPVWLAASTHPGEEVIIAEAHRRLQKDHPDILTIIVPRHAERGREIVEALTQLGESAVLRSEAKVPSRADSLFVADTMGELGLFYRAAPVSFIGGSLVAHGGQNPIEAAKLGSVLLHGPHISNFAAVYAALDRKQASTHVDGPASLAQAVHRFLISPERAKSTARAAFETVESLGGAVEHTTKALQPFFRQSAQAAE